jgi:Fe2+ or Zn2+ uptake regulation protein
LKVLTWRTIPLRNVVLSILEKRQGVVIDKELTRLLKNNRINVTPDELDRALMELEISGKIHVQQITKAKRKIELLGERRYLAIAED